MGGGGGGKGKKGKGGGGGGGGGAKAAAPAPAAAASASSPFAAADAPLEGAPADRPVAVGHFERLGGEGRAASRVVGVVRVPLRRVARVSSLVVAPETGSAGGATSRVGGGARGSGAAGAAAAETAAATAATAVLASGGSAAALRALGGALAAALAAAGADMPPLPAAARASIAAGAPASTIARASAAGETLATLAATGGESGSGGFLRAPLRLPALSPTELRPPSGDLHVLELASVAALAEAALARSKCSGCPRFPKQWAAAEEIRRLSAHLGAVRERFSDESLALFPELLARKAVMRRLG
jgi:hypothetical protein